MITVNLDKELIVNAIDTENRAVAHYSREAIMAICAKAAWILN
jgi:hypothetical protein